MNWITQKELFVITTLGLSSNKENKQFYYKTNVYYKKWKKDLFDFYNLRIKKLNNNITMNEEKKLNKLIKKLSRNNIL